MSDGEADGAGPEPARVRRIATICNQRGLHARASARFVKMAALYDADVRVRKNGTEVSGRSIMGLMMLAAASGADRRTQRQRTAGSRGGKRARRFGRMQIQ